MILGHIRDNFPYLTLSLPGFERQIYVEFLIDTGFDGFLALPSSVLQQLDTTYTTERIVRTADGTLSRRRVYEVAVNWSGEQDIIEVIELDGGIPLLGVELLADNLITMEMVDGGEVSIEPM